MERFGDSAALADELLRAVTEGPKRATSELAYEFLSAGDTLPRTGSHWIACDGAGVPRVVLRTVELRLGPFTSADEAFARDEGEDDGSLKSWQAEHRRYWTRTRASRGLEWTESDEIVFERFRVVWPAELATRPRVRWPGQARDDGLRPPASAQVAAAAQIRVPATGAVPRASP
ncbi:ASCH domain-containing protein [Arthrobacter sp. IA7]|nr:ASCH domain-containing protein [Arthrobacter ipis]